MFLHHAPFSTNVSQENGSLVLYLTGELDVASAPMLRQTVSDLVRADTRDLTLDLAGLTFVDVVGLRAVLQAQRAAASVGATFRLCAVSDLSRWVIRLLNCTDLEAVIEGPADLSAA